VGCNLNIADFSVDGYHPIDKDLYYNPMDRGLLVYVHNSIFFKRRSDLENLNFGSIWLELRINHHRVLFGLMYRSPSQPVGTRQGLRQSVRWVRYAYP
jgi:hypothetical protein